MKLSLKSWMLGVIVLSSGWLTISGWAAPGGAGPSEAIKVLNQKVDRYRFEDSEVARQANRDLKKEILTGTFDLEKLCSLAMTTHWKDRSTKEKEEFVGLMRDLLERKAILSVEQGNSKQKKFHTIVQSEKFIGPDQTKSLVHTTIRVPSEDLTIALDYKLSLIKGEWKVYDVIVDGASLVANYRAQFDKIINKDGYPELIHRMQNKLKDLKVKEGEGSGAGNGAAL